MSSEQVDTSPELDHEIELPGDPALRAELKAGIEELTASMARAQGEREFQREALTALSKKVGVEKRKISKFAKWKFKGDNTAKKEAINVSSAQAAFEILYGDGE